MGVGVWAGGRGCHARSRVHTQPVTQPRGQRDAHSAEANARPTHCARDEDVAVRACWLRAAHNVPRLQLQKLEEAERSCAAH